MTPDPVNRSTGHTHTDREQHSRHRHAHTRQEQHLKPPNEHFPQTLHYARMARPCECTAIEVDALGIITISATRIPGGATALDTRPCEGTQSNKSYTVASISRNAAALDTRPYGGTKIEVDALGVITISVACIPGGAAALHTRPCKKRNRSHTQIRNENKTTHDTPRTTPQQHNTRYDKNNTTNDHTKNRPPRTWQRSKVRMYKRRTKYTGWNWCVLGLDMGASAQ